MIPKKIHYCWFGGSPLTDEAKRYIETWRKNCSDYEIVEWNEYNFDVSENKYCREAYEKKKWAFVADYARLKVLYDNGGIYMDTDVEVVRKFDDLLFDGVFCCFENKQSVSIGTLGAEKGHEFLKKILDLYKECSFVMTDGTLDMTPNLEKVTTVLSNEYNLEKTGEFQCLNNKVNIYPMEYFIAKDYLSNELKVTSKTYAIHHYTGSWLSGDIKEYNMKFKKFYALTSWISNEWLRLKITRLLTDVDLKVMSGIWKHM